jgi:hypothetical protein
MLPRKLASNEVLASRKRAFIHRIRTSHWPVQIIQHGLISENPVDLTQCTRDQLLLVGYTDWDSVWDVNVRKGLKNTQEEVVVEGSAKGGGGGSSEKKEDNCVVM